MVFARVPLNPQTRAADYLTSDNCQVRHSRPKVLEEPSTKSLPGSLVSFCNHPVLVWPLQPCHVVTKRCSGVVTEADILYINRNTCDVLSQFPSHVLTNFGVIHLRVTVSGISFPVTSHGCFHGLDYVVLLRLGLLETVRYRERDTTHSGP
jgi:hypothetical protein